MLPLPTEAAVEAMNVFTDRRHPFNTYNDRKRFSQFGFTHRSRHRRRGEKHRNLEWKGVIETLTSRLQSVLLSDFDILIAYNSLILQHKQTYFVPEIFFIACHYSNSSVCFTNYLAVCLHTDPLHYLCELQTILR